MAQYEDPDRWKSECDRVVGFINALTKFKPGTESSSPPNPTARLPTPSDSGVDLPEPGEEKPAGPIHSDIAPAAKEPPSPIQSPHASETPMPVSNEPYQNSTAHTSTDDAPSDKTGDSLQTDETKGAKDRSDQTAPGHTHSSTASRASTPLSQPPSEVEDPDTTSRSEETGAAVATSDSPALSPQPPSTPKKTRLAKRRQLDAVASTQDPPALNGEGAVSPRATRAQKRKRQNPN